MKKLNFCVVGAGNISNTRHIPAMLKSPSINIFGVIGSNKSNVENTKKRYNIQNAFCIEENEDFFEQVNKCSWICDIDAVIIGTPPQTHYQIASAFLALGKHVLLEKPMAMNVEECDQLIKLANDKKLILNVMHTFQFSNGMHELEKRFNKGEFGTLESILEIQLTNRNRRLPSWYNELPLGLFYDEAAHFFYSALKFGDGELQNITCSAIFNKDKERTPKFLQVQLDAGTVPVQMIMNFNSPICEWGLMLLCEKKIAIYDYFKDILVVMDNDGLHLAKDVVKVSSQFSFGFWKGFFKSGLLMLSGKLFYGHDKTIAMFVEAIKSGVTDKRISAECGRKVVEAMNEVVIKIERIK